MMLGIGDAATDSYRTLMTATQCGGLQPPPLTFSNGFPDPSAVFATDAWLKCAALQSTLPCPSNLCPTAVVPPAAAPPPAQVAAPVVAANSPAVLIPAPAPPTHLDPAPTCQFWQTPSKTTPGQCDTNTVLVIGGLAAVGLLLFMGGKR